MRDYEHARDRALLTRVVALCDPPVSAATQDALGAYVELVARWNRKLDLTAARGPEAQLDVLLADACVLSRASLCQRDARLIDVGTGAGAPLVPLLLLRPDLRATAVEPLHKRVAFLRTAIGRLLLMERMQVLERRLEAARPEQDLGGPFDLALSRATFAPQAWLELGLALAPRAVLAFAQGEPPPTAAGRVVGSVEHYSLPFSGAPRALCLYARRG